METVVVIDGEQIGALTGTAVVFPGLSVTCPVCTESVENVRPLFRGGTGTHGAPAPRSIAQLNPCGHLMSLLRYTMLNGIDSVHLEAADAEHLAWWIG